MGNCLTKLNNVVLLFNRPSLRLSCLRSLSNGVLPTGRRLNSVLRVVLSLRASPLTIPLGWKARFALRDVLTCCFVFADLLVGWVKRVSLTLSIHVSFPCVKVGCMVTGWAGELSSATRRDMMQVKGVCSETASFIVSLRQQQQQLPAWCVSSRLSVFIVSFYSPRPF